MSNFCHDDYDHPLLWCDGKRRLVERQNAAQAQVLVRQQKEDERRQRIVEQREVTDEIRDGWMELEAWNYNPICTHAHQFIRHFIRVCGVIVCVFCVPCMLRVGGNLHI